MSAPSNNENEVDQKISFDALEELDFNEIEDMPWAQELWQDLEKHTKKAFLNWCHMVRSVAGTSKENTQEWRELYIQTVDEILCDMVLDVALIQKSTIEEIEELCKRLQKACLELHQPIPPKIGDKKLCLYEEKAQLMKYIKEHETVIKAKREELNTLHKKQLSLCKHLGQEPKFILQYPPLPTPEQLENFRKHLEQMEAEIFVREERYCHLKHEITENVKILKYKATCEFEKEVLVSDNFMVTTENMEQLEFFAKCLKEIKKSTEEEISQFRSRIEDLWKMLDIDLRDRDEFRTHYTGNSLDTLHALRDEVKRCEEIRKANVKIFVEKLRVELESLWQICHCSDVERRNFRYFNNDCYTEDLLEIHELEIQKWTKYHEENKRLLELLTKHEELWKKAIELEEKGTDPNRYKNRGGKLLQEEKERNAVSKLIPKIEEEILVLSYEFRVNNDASFMSFGRTPEEYLDQIHAERENTRKLKLSARKMQRDNTQARTPGKQAINLFPSTSTAVTPTMLSATKRKILATPKTEDSKRLRMNTPRNIGTKSKATARTVPKIKVTYATMSLPKQRRKSSIEQSRRRRSVRGSKNVERTREELIDTNDTYSEFHNEMSSRGQCRSTLAPDEALQRTPVCPSSGRTRAPVQNPISLFKTPSKTPISLRTPLTGKFSQRKKTHLKL